MTDFKLLEKLCLTNGISGDENTVREIILSEIKDYCEKVEIDNLGNIIAFKKGNASPSKKLMISAHMDEVGFIVTNITENGFLKFSTVGGIDEKVMLGKPVKIGKNLIPGVIGLKPIHLIEPPKRQDPVDLTEMYIDIGAENKNDALKYVNLGDPVYFDSTFEIENDIIKSKALDDRAGCFILIDLIKKELPFDVYFTFVTQEEIGLRGATVAAFNVNPDIAFVIEATTASDVPFSKEENFVCKINDGSVISFMDKATIYDRELCNKAFDTANENNIKVQHKKAVSGGNDSGAIHKSRSGVKTLSLSIPCRYLHSAMSLISTSDLLNVENLAYHLIFKVLD